jgi:hypothetical protein
MGWFNKKVEDLSFPANRSIKIDKPNQRDFYESLRNWDQYWHQRSRWRWRQIPLKGVSDNGWHKGEPTRWQVGKMVVESRFDVKTGIVTETIIDN